MKTASPDAVTSPSTSDAPSLVKIVDTSCEPANASTVDRLRPVEPEADTSTKVSSAAKSTTLPSVTIERTEYGTGTAHRNAPARTFPIRSEKSQTRAT
jgi:hypothetical protein